ncbi:RdgB/HAM1 family non-canonical purine NTP pyrophosphatase [Egicoccus sp. AB-alg2]|uniref:RdgB/HAM1 family non-canonical purine NTP pyrophosphatase n=1 Tax=Egicoccus sp. AB-alg2 TaxID=3242693 RepID=UPI00359CCC80
MTRRLVAATANAHKLAEIQALLDHLDVEVVAMQALGVPSPPEDAETFEGNALIKARACHAATGLPAIADDSGLEVDALGGEPGVRSARYAGEQGDDAANNAKLVAALRDVPPPRRTARFVSAVAFVAADGTEHVVRGTMEGHVVDRPRGGNGFGYDPYFVGDDGDGRTNAELSPEEKNARSHRGAAFRAIVPALAQAFADA